VEWTRRSVLAEFVDHLAPRLDTYEQTIYLYAMRHSRLEGHEEIVIVVAACLGCNNRKGDTTAEDFLRRLYCEGFLSDGDLEAWLRALKQLRAGEMRPVL